MIKQQKKPGVVVKKKVQKQVPVGIVCIKATFNNTIVTITDSMGKVLVWSSAGKSHFSGSRKSTAYAGTVAAQGCAKVAMNLGMKEVDVVLKGPGAGRESAVRGLQSAGLRILSIADKTPQPHNGCRPRKARRV